MTEEEVKIKCGMDWGPMQVATENVRKAWSNLGKDAANTFTNADSASRKWNQTMNKLTDQVPLLGHAISTAFSPIAGLIAGGTAAVGFAIKAFQNYNKELDGIAERASKPIGNPEESRRQALKNIAKTKAEAEEFRSEMSDGKPGEKDEQDYQVRLSHAKEAAAGDEAAYLAAKRLIDLDEIAIQKEKEKAALERFNAAELEKENVGKELAAEDLPKKIAGQIKEQERINEAIKKLVAIRNDIDEINRTQPGVVKTASETIASIIPPGASAAGALGAAAMLLSKGTPSTLASDIAIRPESLLKSFSPGETDSKLAKLREELARSKAFVTEAESKIASGEDLADKNDLDKAKADARAAKSLIAKIEKGSLADEEKLREAARKSKSEAITEEIELAKIQAGGDEVRFLNEKIAIEELALIEAEAAGDKKRALELEKDLRRDNIVLIEEEKNKEREQGKLDRDIAKHYADKKEASISPYRPALEEIANSMAWNPGDLMVRNLNRQNDARSEQMGMTWMQREGADSAQKLIIAEEEAARAFKVSGPESDRFKEALKRKDSLKAGLEKSGLLKKDNSEAIEQHLADLLEKASREGLVVQPVNGP